MAKPNNREEFKALILRKCGLPVIELEIDDEQVEDCIDEALKYFYDYHYDGSEKVFVPYRLTAQDVTNQYITISENIHFITKIIEINNRFLTNNIFGIRYQLALNDLFNISAGALSDFQNTMRHVELLSEMFAVRPGLTFNRFTNRLKITAKWGTDLKEDDWIVMECFRIMDPEIYPDVWNDRWLTNYTSLLVRRQIGLHLMKYNITLPGNVTYNGEQIYNIANEEIRLMEEKMLNDFSIPPSDLIS